MGRCLTVVLAGYSPRKLPPLQSFFGRIGREQKPPPQFGQTLSRMFSTQERQKVHSNVQIIASVEFGGSAALQFSQVGLSSSMAVFCSRSKPVGFDRGIYFESVRLPIEKVVGCVRHTGNLPNKGALRRGGLAAC